MKTYKQFQNITEAFKEPNLERMKKQANNADIGTILKYTRHKDIQDDIDKIYKNRPAGKQKEIPVYYRDSSGSVGRRRHPKDLLSNQNAIKFDMKKYQVAKNSRRAQNIRAKINQYHADPLGYMSKSFGGPHIDTGMDMKRRPAKKKVEEAYKEPNIQRMQKQAEKHLYRGDRPDVKLDYQIDQLSRGKSLEGTGFPDKNIYFRNKEGKIQRNLRPDLQSIRSFENRMNKQRDNSVRRYLNVSKKLKQYHNDPLGYMSKSFGGPTINPEGWQDAPKRRKTK